MEKKPLGRPPKPLTERVMRDFDLICMKHHFSIREILGKSRMKHVVINRQTIIMELLEKGYNQTLISKALRMNRSSVAHYIKRATKEKGNV